MRNRSITRSGAPSAHANTSFENHPPIKRKIIADGNIRSNGRRSATLATPPYPKQYEGSIHAALFRDSNTWAPVCMDCHSPHAVMAKASYEAATGAPCSKCHSPIFDAYAGSVHGKATLACSSHRAHDVSAATKTGELKGACLGCHQDAQDSHQKCCRMPSGISMRYRAPRAIRPRPSARSTSGFTTTWHSNPWPKKRACRSSKAGPAQPTRRAPALMRWHCTACCANSTVRE